MSSQKAGRGGLLHVGYPHQGTVNDGIAVRWGLFAVAATPDYFSAVSRTGGFGGYVRRYLYRRVPFVSFKCIGISGTYGASAQTHYNRISFEDIDERRASVEEVERMQRSRTEVDGTKDYGLQGQEVCTV